MALACAANFAMFFAFYLLLPVTVAYLHTQLGATYAQVGLILSSNMVMAIMIRPFAGYLLSRFDRNRLLMLSFAGFALCFWGYIVAPNMAVFTVIRAFHGLAFSLTTVALNTVAIDIMPSEKRTKWLSYFSVMSNAAMAVGPMVALYFFDRHHDFVELFSIAIVMSMVGLVLSMMIRSHHLQDRSHVESTMSLDRFLLRKGLLVALVITFVALSYGMLITYITMYGNTVSGAISGSGVFFFYFATAMVFSRILTAGLYNKGHLKVLSGSALALLVISYAVFLIHANPWTYYASGLVMGAMYGILAPTLQGMIGKLAGSRQRGTANATYLVSWDFGVGVGVLLGGMLTSIDCLSYAYGVAAMGLVFALVMLVAVVGPHYSRNKLS